MGRGLRFGIPGVLLGMYGENLNGLEYDSMEVQMIFVLSTILGLIVVIPAARWWKGLLDEEE